MMYFGPRKAVFYVTSDYLLCSGLLELKASCIVPKKGDKLVELVSFCVVEFILQNCEIGDFHQFDLAFVLLLPASQN